MFTTKCSMDFLKVGSDGDSSQRAANGGSDPSWLSLAFLGRPDFQSRGPQIPIFLQGDLCREGANREKLTVKKIINNEMFFFSPFMSLINREKLCVNREKSVPKIHHFFTVSFSPFRSSWLWTENRGAPKTPNSTMTDLTPHLRPSDRILFFCASSLFHGVPKKEVVPRGRFSIKHKHHYIDSNLTWDSSKLIFGKGMRRSNFQWK